MQRWQKRQILEEWRGLPEDRKGPDAQPIRRTLDRMLKDLGLDEKLMEDQILEAWDEIVGEYHARLARPVSLKKGWLVVGVLQPTVMYDLERFHKAEILRRMQERFGKNTIRGIRFRAGS